MARHPERALSAVKVRNAPEGFYCDGNGLYLRVDESGARRWVLRTVVRGKRRELGLGGLRLVSLAEAREEAIRLRKIARRGGDPLIELRSQRKGVPSFEEAARIVHQAAAKTFRNIKHRLQWIATLSTYVFPVFGSKPIDLIGPPDVLAALAPIWTEKPETARRIRQRMRAVFDWAKAAGFRSGDNPVEGISKALPKHTGKKNHFPALPYQQAPAFIEALRISAAGIPAKLGFEFLILTAARTSEVRLAKWDEIGLHTAVWTVPPERMKAGVEHRVPLSTRCLEILRQARELNGQYLFPGMSADKPLSNMAFEMTLRRMERGDITVHGFRSSFRDWAEERTNYKRSVVEAALAHTVRDKVEGAYLRSKLFNQRIPLMDAWSAFAMARPAEKIVKFRGA